MASWAHAIKMFYLNYFKRSVSRRMDADPVIANNGHIGTAFLPPDNSRNRNDPDILTAAYCTLTNQISKNKPLVLDMML
jgi:hypothetical protein